MDRAKILELVRGHVKNENSIKHMLATEAVMASLAEKLNEDKTNWGITGLVHDIDMELADYRVNPEKHGILGSEILEKQSFDKSIIEAVKAHNPATGKVPENLMEKAIYCVDPLTGLIVASVLVLPSKKLRDLTTESVLRRFREKSFAKGARREAISACSEIGLTLEEFVQIGLEAMQSISNDIGL